MQTITFNELPAALMDLNRKVDILLSRAIEPKTEQTDPLYTIEQLCEYLPEKPAKQTIYGKVNDRLIPFEKFSKRLYFRKSSIDLWCENGRQMKGL